MKENLSDNVSYSQITSLLLQGIFNYEVLNVLIYNFCSSHRTSGGRLHLLPDVGKILLADATLIEDPSSDSEKDDEGK